MKGILGPNELAPLRRERREATIVFTNGCFDLLHRGHVNLLLEARGLGEILVVGINSDRSVARIKGAGRPLVPEGDRAFILLQLRPVDYVTIFEEDTPLETIQRLEPDVLVKGSEYARGEIVGADFVEARGGSVVRVPMLEGYSTSVLIEKLRA